MKVEHEPQADCVHLTQRLEVARFEQQQCRAYDRLTWNWWDYSMAKLDIVITKEFQMYLY